jgi:hypothetical protein
MKSALVSPKSLVYDRSLSDSPIVADVSGEEASQFGLQAFDRDSLEILKPDCISRFAVFLSLRYKRKEIQNLDFVTGILRRHPSWVDGYRVVHLIERSLWIQGQSDLVMTLTRNPSRIPDNPPPEVTEILTRAYTCHPQATVWYGVPLFGEEKTPAGLPIPLTAAQVRDEAARRLLAAQQHALRWGWFYRSLRRGLLAPAFGVRMARRVWSILTAVPRGFIAAFRRARKTSKLRARAHIKAQQDYCRTGRMREVTVGRDAPWLDRAALTALESAYLVEEMISPTTVGAAAVPLLALKLMFIIPASMVSCDPFLFLELPEEPGKLRHLAHWYWHTDADGKQVLHLHV